MTSSDL